MLFRSEQPAPQRGNIRAGQGGPFVPLFRDLAPSGAGDATTNLESMSYQLGTQLRRLDQIHGVLRAIPLSAPLDNFALMSGFGARHDPFTGQAAMHYGLDMSAPMRTPVMATAPGTVVVAGWEPLRPHGRDRSWQWSQDAVRTLV